MINTILFLIISSLSFMKSEVIYDFKINASLDHWYIVNDGVMGGLSQSILNVTEEGHGQFSGTVSLENYGGFASVRFDTRSIEVSGHTHIRLKVKGDGKRYQFRIKDKRRSYHSYINYFETTGEWETIDIPIASLYPSFRGRTLDMPNFHHDYIEELSILIGNKKAESFRILIDEISLK